jgi:hypothetical protein
MSDKIALTINPEQENFLIIFDGLSYQQKEIWQLLCWFNKHCYVTRPSQTTIARMVGCCRDTVIEAIKKFKEFGWMATIKKAYQTLIYFISDNLLKLDTKDRNIFKKATISREAPAQAPTLSRISSYLKGTYREMYTEDCLKRERTHKPIPEFMKIPAFSLEDRQFFTNRYSEQVLYEAMKDTKDFHINVERIGNIPGFFTDRCKYWEKRRKNNGKY